MDPTKKSALDLIEASVHKLKVGDRGHQLMCVAADYIEDGQLDQARRVLGIIDEAYYDCAPLLEKPYMDAVARVVEVFGADLRLFAKRFAIA